MMIKDWLEGLDYTTEQLDQLALQIIQDQTSLTAVSYTHLKRILSNCQNAVETES